MKKLLLAPFILLVAIAVMGCTDAAPTELAAPSDAAPARGANKNGPPAQSGPHVVRWDDTPIMAIVDDVTGTIAGIGHDAIKGCQIERDTGEWPAWEVWVDLKSIKLVMKSKDDVPRNMATIKGDDLAVTVWRHPGPATCQEILDGVTLLGYGKAKLTWTDNDFGTGENTEPRTNAYGASANGFVTTPEGTRRPFHAMYRCVFDGENWDEQKCKSTVEIR